MTEEQALYKLAALCSQAEHCSGEMVEKLQRWGIGEAAQTRIMAYLTKEGYVDDARYTRAFAHDKLRYNGWGRRKIEQALYAKHVAADISREVLDAVPDSDYLDVLHPLLQQKWRDISGKNDYERSMKLIRFAMGRGYDYELIRKAVDRITSLPDD